MCLSVALGLEPVGVLGQQCQPGPDNNSSSDGMKFLFRMFAVVLTLLLAMCFGAWLFWRKWKRVLKEMDSMQNQLGDHYESSMQLGCAKGLIQVDG